jgi:hypothetical protein
MYDNRYREHRRDGCVSMAPGYLCKLCRSYEAGRNAGLDLVRELLVVDPVVRTEGEPERCLYCNAELKTDMPEADRGHDAGCIWRSARLLLDGAERNGREPGGPIAL